MLPHIPEIFLAVYGQSFLCLEQNQLMRNFIILISFAAVFVTACNPNETKKKTHQGFVPEEHLNMAFIVSQNYVKENLKITANAIFANMRDSQVEIVDNNTYSITSYVDSQNGQGIKWRYHYNMKLRYVTGEDSNPLNWEVVDFKETALEKAPGK